MNEKTKKILTEFALTIYKAVNDEGHQGSELWPPKKEKWQCLNDIKAVARNYGIEIN